MYHFPFPPVRNRQFSLSFAPVIRYCVLFFPILFSCGAQGENVQPAVPNASFEEADADGTPVSWALHKNVYSLDESVARSGKRSLKWENHDASCYALSKVTLAGMTPGCGVKVSVYVKTRGVCDGSGPQICVEYWDENEKFISGNYLSGPKNAPDWKCFGGVCEIPENAAKATMCCYAGSGSTGTIWFDDVEIVPVHIPQILAVTTDRYRHETDGGTVKVYVGLRGKNHSGTASEKTSDAFQNGILRISDASGKTLSEIKASEVKTGETASDSLIFSFDSTPLAPGKYTLTAEVPTKDGSGTDSESLTLTKYEKLPARKAFIDEHERLILDGKPFFPMGLYTHDLTDDDIERLAASPFNCVISYHLLSRETMDKMLAHGIYTIYSAGFWKEEPQKGDEAAAKRIQELKDHPGIIAWYVFDEAPLAQKEELTAHYRTVTESDPSRPALAVTDKPEEIRALIPTYDVIGTDPYPITRPWNMNLDASQAYDWTRKTHEAVWGERALWQVPQVFNWGIYNKLDIPQERFRRPTYDEMRAMIWMCIAGGGNGIVGYSFYDILYRTPEGSQLTPEEKKARAEEHWDELIRIMRDVEKRVPILLSTETPAEITPAEDSSEKIASRLYAYEGKTWLLLVNTSAEPQTARFRDSAGRTLEILNPGDLNEAQISAEKDLLEAEIPPLTPIFIQLNI